MSFVTDLTARIGFFAQPNSDLGLLPELVRHFLTKAIEDRATVLAAPANEQPERYLDSVLAGYTQRMENLLAEEVTFFKDKNPELTFPRSIDGRLREVRFHSKLAKSDFSNPQNFERLLNQARLHFRFSGMFKPLPMPPSEARAIAGVMLRAVQRVALQIISNDYPATAKEIVVPSTTKTTIGELLREVDAIAAQLLPSPAIKTLPQAEAELRVAVARSELRVELPVRSIPTAPLTDDDLEKHYKGRPDEDAHRLARQVRHADGTILVTGYRGVGKSSFVNRVIYHALRCQTSVPGDGWLLVPVTINLAKVAGVQNILRIALRSVRTALIDPNTGKANPIPGFANSTQLPLDEAKEIEPLQEAYTRATYKVTMTRANATESKLALDGGIGFDISKLWPVSGVSLPSFGLKGSRSRTATLNRSLSLLDYDENAAETDLMDLIYRLATPRVLYGESGPEVRIKLVFIFDELDKMDTDTGLQPMIEGLKNLFLQRNAVFVLVTSKMFYYHLLAERAKEDSMLSSYFSAIVPVPLLNFEQARKMVDDWIDWPEIQQPRLDIENNLLDQLTRWLLYRSYGNPRDIIRELRQMQEWADTTERPYLSDRLSKSQSLLIFAEIQKCIEKVARAGADSNKPMNPTPEDNGLTLVSERLGGDESRLEQVRRGLYILTEALINQEQLSLQPADLEELRKNNFSLLRMADVEQLAAQLGNNLSLLHENLPMEVFSSLSISKAPDLFMKQGNEWIRTTPEFYRLTGRQAAVADTEVKPAETDGKSVAAATKNVTDLIPEAERLASQSGWAEQMAAIGIIKQLGPASLSPALESFLVTLATNTGEPSAHRKEAARQLTAEMIFKKKRDLTELVTLETDAEVLSLFLPLLGKASDQTAKKRACDALLALFRRRRGPGEYLSLVTTELQGQNAEIALTVLPAVATQDVLDDVLDWLSSTIQSEEVQESALATLNLLAKKLNIDQAEKILSNDKFFTFFVTALPLSTARPTANAGAFMLLSTQMREKYEAHLRTLFSVKPLDYIEKLLRMNSDHDLTYLLTALWQAAFDRANPKLAEFVIGLLATEDRPEIIAKLKTSLAQTPEFEVRMQPYLQNVFESTTTRYPDQEREKIRVGIEQIATTAKLLKNKEQPVTSNSSVSEEVVNQEDPGARSRSVTMRARLIGSLVIAIPVITITLFIDVFLFKRGLPSVNWFKALLSRVILLSGDTAIVALLLNFMTSVLDRRVLRLGRRSSSSQNFAYKSYETKTFSYFMVLAGGAAFYAHQSLFGPLTLSDQVLLFLVNLLPSVILGWLVVRAPLYRTFPDRRSG